MTKPAILVEGLKKSYGDVEALKGIDFEVPPGTIFGLLGPNGAGKTTAVRILSTILEPTAGRAEVLGYDVRRQAAQVRMLIGLAGQSAAVDPNLTGRENLKLIGKLAQLPRSEIRGRADELLERFQLTDAGDRPIRTYSGGMRRRLDVAASLVAKPPVIFLDEPTTGLDIQSRTELWRVIEELVADGATVLLTTQYLEEADQLADRIAVVNHGIVVANDTAATLKAKLGNTVIELTMQDQLEARRAQQLLARLVSDHPELEGDKVRLSTNQAPRVLTEVLRSLDANGMVAEGLTVRDPSLDDVFLALTGKHAGENGGADQATKKSKPGPQPPRAIEKAVQQVDEWIEDLEPVRPEVAAFDERWQPAPDVWDPQEAPEFPDEAGLEGGEDESPGTATELGRLLQQLPYRAGSGTVEENLREVAEAALRYYSDASARRPLDIQPVAGYLLLEQRFGRISDEAATDQAASILMGAAVARAVGLGLGSAELNGEAAEFAESAVRILLEGIGEDV